MEQPAVQPLLQQRQGDCLDPESHYPDQEGEEDDEAQSSHCPATSPIVQRCQYASGFHQKIVRAGLAAPAVEQGELLGLQMIVIER
jgi:hypothetical protein